MLKIIGAVSLFWLLITALKLILALRFECDLSTAFAPTPPRDAFVGKVVWITGASSGIGRSLALRMASSYENVRLILSSRRKGALEAVAKECRERSSTGGGGGDDSGLEVKILPLDLNKLSSLPGKAQEALALYDTGTIDVLVNNGGVSTRTTAKQSTFDVDQFVANVDYLSYVALTKALIPSWEATKDTGALIINTSSVSGKFGVPVRTAYCGAKHALHGWFDAFRVEQILAGTNIRVMNVVLGSTSTDVDMNAIGETSQTKFGQRDENIRAGLDPDHVVGQIIAAAHAGLTEPWIAPRKELLAAYLGQYMPETAKKILTKSVMKKYAVDGKSQGVGGDNTSDDEL